MEDNSIEPVVHCFAYCLDFLMEQVADVSEADMVAQPDGILNHPAWVIGHLAHTCEMLAPSTSTIATAAECAMGRRRASPAAT